MRQNDVVAANGHQAATIFDDACQQQLMEILGRKETWGGILDKVLAQLLEHGTANYSDLLQIQVVATTINRDTENLLAIVTGIRSIDCPPKVSSLTLLDGVIPITSAQLHDKTHPLLAD